MSGKLLKQLSSYNLKMGAFELVEMFSDGIYEKDLVYALQVFSKLPCKETAINLITFCPDAFDVMLIADDSFVKSTPKEMLGEKYDGLEKFIVTCEENLRVVENMNYYLLKASKKGDITIGFHRTRNQDVLYGRLKQVGIKKGIFNNGRQFLRDEITNNLSAFRSVADLICVHGIYDHREVFWNTLGQQVTASFHLRSEIQYHLSSKKEIESFITFLKVKRILDDHYKSKE